MKKLILSIFVAFIGVYSAKATITLINHDTKQVIANGTTYQVWGDVSEVLITWHGIDAINNTGGTTKINMKRYTISAQATVEDYFCWYVCLGSVNSVNTPTLNHSTGACYNSNDGDTITFFSNYYKSQGLTGSATYRYVWFNASNPSDTAYADVVFNVTPVGIHENQAVAGASVYPNPAKNLVNLTVSNFDLKGSERIELFDLIGNRVFSAKLNGIQTTFDVSEFDNGIYILNVVSDKKAIITRRVVINR